MGSHSWKNASTSGRRGRGPRAAGDSRQREVFRPRRPRASLGERAGRTGGEGLEDALPPHLDVPDDALHAPRVLRHHPLLLSRLPRVAPPRRGNASRGPAGGPGPDHRRGPAGLLHAPERAARPPAVRRAEKTRTLRETGLHETPPAPRLCRNCPLAPRRRLRRAAAVRPEDAAARTPGARAATDPERCDEEKALRAVPF